MAKKLQYALEDSERFGLKIFRSMNYELNVPGILEQIMTEDVDVAIIRIPSTALSQIHTLEKTGMPYIIADTLATYEFDLATYEPLEMANNNIALSLATAEDHSELNFLVKETFGSYSNHYRMNPFFDNESVNEGYKDWMRSYAGENEEKICWIVRRKGEPIAFAAYKYIGTAGFEGVLYGVLPRYRKRGIFRDLMINALNHAKEKDLEYMRVITQIENVAVQRIWTKLGFGLHHHDSTIHVNAMLSKTVFDSFDVPLVFKNEDFDPLKEANRCLLAKINWNFDIKRNMKTSNHQFVNFRPIEPALEYNMKFSFPNGRQGLLRLADKASGKIYALIYFDISHFIS
jgi:ribosomal protein S18 acetylase RimI-like enzyme